MKAEEKKCLYNFFKIASEYLNGYATEEDVPDFSDDKTIDIAFSSLIRLNGGRLKYLLVCELIETEASQMFSDKASELLDKMLIAINLKRGDDIFKYSMEEIDSNPQSFYNALQEQINKINPKAILTVGNLATQKLLNSNDEINKLHGKFFEYNGLPVMGIFHPNALLKDANLKRPAWEDLKLFNSKLQQIESNG